MRYVVSLYESDAQIPFLLSKGFADFTITEDSDLLAYGCKKVCFFKTYYPIVVGNEGANSFRACLQGGMVNLTSAGFIPGGGGGEDLHMKGAEKLVILLRGVNFTV